MMHGFRVGDIVKPAKDTIGVVGLEDPGDGNWITSKRGYRMKNEPMMCIGFIRAAHRGLTTSDYDHNVDIAIVLHVQHKIITFLPAEECEVIL